MDHGSIFRVAPQSVKAPKKVSFQTFLRKYAQGGPGVKHEYNKGIIETTEAMKLNEQYLAFNLLNYFATIHAPQRKGHISQKVEVWTSANQWRRPDMAYISIE